MLRFPLAGSTIRNSLTVFLVLTSGNVPSGAAAQTTDSVLEGRVLDTTGAALPGASVVAQGPRDSLATATDAEGRYRIAPLSPGVYSVSVTRAGFRPVTLDSIDIPVNRAVPLDVTLTIAGQPESVTVTAASLIDRTDSARPWRFDAQTIEALPLNGRNYLDLLSLTPGVTVNDVASSTASSRDTRGSILGERAGNTAFLVDGFENNDDFRGGVFQDLSLDAVQEFEVLSTGFHAEFGGGSGGVVNVVTRSGANALDGTGYFFVRNDALDASNISGTDAPELSRYDYGFAAGGPVTRDRAWFFGSVERIDEKREAIFAPNIPESLRAGEDFSQTPGSDDRRVIGKYTRRLGTAHELRFLTNWTRLESLNRLAGPTSLPSTSDDVVNRGAFGGLSVTSVLGARTLLESSVSARGQTFDQNREHGDVRSFSVLFLDDNSSFEFGPRLGTVQSMDQRYVTGREVMTFTPGYRHTFKAGAEFTRTDVHGENEQGLQHVIATTRANFAVNGRDSFQIAQGVGFATPGDQLTDLQNTGVSLFAQDDWRPVDAFTFNLGVRYDYDTRFDASGNVAPRLGLVWSAGRGTVVRASWGRFYDRYRLGIAQAVPELGGFNGRTVVEIDYPRLTADALLPVAGGLNIVSNAARDPHWFHRMFGIPLDAVVTRDNVMSLTGLSPETFLARLNTALLASPVRIAPVDFSPYTGFLRQDQGGFQDAIRVARPFTTPYNDTFSTGVERLLPGQLSVGATYVHRRIRNVLGVRITNLARESLLLGVPTTTDGAPLQRSYGPWYDGRYDAFIASVERRFGGRVELQANYTYARSRDNLLNANLGIGVGAQGGGAVPTDNLDLELDRGNSSLAVPHTFAAAGLAALPWGFWVSGAYRATSGVFFSAAGPSVDYDGDGLRSSRPRGTARNAFRGPATHNLDVRVERKFGAGGRVGASVLVECFNLTNARNPRLIENAYVGGEPVATFGDTRVPLSGREGQLGLRLSF